MLAKLELMLCHRGGVLLSMSIDILYNIYIYIYIYVCICVCVCVCFLVFVCMSMYVCVCVYIYICTHWLLSTQGVLNEFYRGVPNPCAL